MPISDSTAEQQSTPFLEDDIELLQEPDHSADALPTDFVLNGSSDEVFRVTRLLRTDRSHRIYEGVTNHNNSPVHMREAVDEETAAILRQEAQLLAGLACQMFPTLL